ncbi:MAG: hypothetical protein ACM3JL_00030 [Nitrososphaerota archaeon]
MTSIGSRADGSAQGAGGALRAGALTPAVLVLSALAVLGALAPASAAAAPAAECPNSQRRAEQGSAALPDCRAYELVTPAGKDSAEPLGALTTYSAERDLRGAAGARASIGGDRFAWWSEYALPQASLSQPYAPGVPGLHYLSTRTNGGWTSENVVPPQATEYGLACQQLVGMVGWSANLERGVLADGIAQESALSPGGPFANQKLECGHEEPRIGAAQAAGLEEREGFQNLFVRDGETGAYRLLNATPEGAPRPRPSYEGQEYFPASFLAGSDDLSHVVFEEELPLTEAAERITPEVEEACEKGEPGCWEGHDNLYEWSEGAAGEAGSVRLATVLPDGSPVEGALAGATRNNGGGGNITEPGKIPMLQLSLNVAAFRHAVSADGSRVFFETGSGLYVREDGTTTVRIDAARSGLPGASDGGGSFMAADADGSAVYFTADASHLLTADTVPGSGENLYECALPASDGGECALTDLTPAAEAGVLGIAGTGEGAGSEEEGADPYVYFVATGVLSAGVGPIPGQPNLYLRHDGSTAYVATLAGGEEGTSPDGTPCTKNTQSSCHVTYGDSCDWTGRGGCDFIYENEELKSVAGGLTSRVSTDGRFLAFNSIESLTGYDNEDAGSGGLPGEKTDAEIFVYDAVIGTLRCASCNPDPSVRPTAPATIRWPARPDGNVYQHAVYPQHNLTDSGQLFFESYDPLLPADTGGALSVYEYDAGSGRLALISSGASETESVFLDATPSGSDAFFMTADRLLPGDEDSAFDVYDARAGGGFPEARQATARCEDEAHCRPAAHATTPVPAPGTASFAGPGNLQPGPVSHPRKHRHRRKHHRRRRKHHRPRKPHRHGQRGGARSSSLAAGDPATATTAAPEGGDEAPVEAGTAPIVVTEAAEHVEVESAVLVGKVYREVVFNSPQCVVLGLICHNSAGSKITGCAFQLATAAYYESHGGSYDQQAACEPPPPYPETDQVELVKGPLAGLEPSTVYHFRLTATNEAGQTGAGEDLTFTTLGSSGPPTVDSEDYELSHQGDGSFTATLSARIDPHGYATSCSAQYVSEAEFQQSGFAEATGLPCTPATLPAGFRGEEETATASGLPPGGRYHFRFLAENEQGSVAGADRTFLTFAVESFEALPSEQQAGGHPEALSERFRMSTATESPWGSAFPSFAVVNPRNIVTDLPPGLIGNPLATPRCAQQELINATCSGAAQVGVLRIEGNRRQGAEGPYVLPLYNLVPPAGVAAQLGAPLPPPVHAAAHVDAGLGAGYGIEAASLGTTAAEGLISVDATIWGLPHDPVHDAERFCPLPGNVEEPEFKGGECPSDAALEADLRPFLRNPTSCSEAPTATLAVDAWQAPGDAVEARYESAPMEGCAAVPFEPGFIATPTATSADAPTGLHVALHLPQPQDAAGVGEADLRKAVVALPPGLQVNAASADGLAGCAPAQIELAGPEPARCPDGSKIGTVKVSTPLLERPLRGGVYVASPHENPFGSLLALYIAVEDPQTGVVVKLAGKVEADHATGRLTTTFDQSPQLPFEDFELDFFAGPRAPLKTPTTCGSFETTAALTPWTTPEGEVATRASSFQIGSGPGGSACVASPDQAPHNPGFAAGTLTPQAGAYSPFVLHLSRADGSQEIEGVSTTLPPGLTGRLAGVPYCPDPAIERAATRDGRAELASPDCPAGSRVGTVTVAAGAGADPYEVSGDAYLAGPYRGAPLSLAVVTPAVAGPFDLGTVVVRAALYVDPETARIHAVAGPIPSMIQGIPLDVRSIALQLDRPRFTLNPTSCDPTAIAGTALSTLGRGAVLGERFQVGGCAGLPFAPQLALSLEGGTRHGAHPALKAVLTTQPGEANIAGAAVTLPHAEFLEQGHLQNICTRVQFNEGAGNGAGCPPSSVYGFARAETPLLDRPLEGPVYLRASSHQLPDLVAALGGQVDVVLDSRVDSVKGRLRSSFEAVPDAPVSKFTLEMPGGAKGLLVNSTDVCAAPRGRRRAVAFFSGQNGKVFQSRPELKVSCKKKSRKKRKRRKMRRHGHHRR